MPPLTPYIQLTDAPLDAAALEAQVAHAGAGAVCTFSGLVRDHNLGRAVTHLEYEAHPDLARAEMARIAAEAADRWPGTRMALAHRMGRLAIGEASVIVSASAPHRAHAFEACRFAIDELKVRVPIWKKEFWSDGSAWVEGIVPHAQADNASGPELDPSRPHPDHPSSQEKANP